MADKVSHPGFLCHILHKKTLMSHFSIFHFLRTKPGEGGRPTKARKQ